MQKFELTPVQAENVRVGKEIFKKYKVLYLELETRTGKTPCSVTICKEMGYKSVLFVTKKAAIGDIKKTIKDFGIDKDLDVEVISVDSVYNAKKFAPYNINKNTIEKLFRSAKNDVMGYWIRQHINPDRYDAIIIDEAHNIGAIKITNRAKALKLLVQDTPVIYLSATPTPECASQFFHQFYISELTPFSKYANFYRWADDFVDITIEVQRGREIKNYTQARLQDIKELTGHYFVTTTQEQAGFKQTIREEFIYVPTPDIVIDLIKDMIKKSVIKVGNERIVAWDVLSQQQKVHQICSGTILDNYLMSKPEEDTSAKPFYTVTKPIIISRFKADYLRDNFKDKKLAIFYCYKAELQLLSETFPDEWTEDPLEFQSGKRIFLGQFVSAREGINLSSADYTIFYNIDYSYLSYAQAKQRMQSHLREKEAVLYWIFSEAGIEKDIYNYFVTAKHNFNKAQFLLFSKQFLREHE